jgi:hypothetical protein
MAQHDRGEIRLQAEKLFEAGRMSPSEVARLLHGSNFTDGDRANIKRYRNAWLKERGLPMPELSNKGLATVSRIHDPNVIKRRGRVVAVNSETLFTGQEPGVARTNPAPTESLSQPDALDTLLATLPIKLPLAVSDEDPLDVRQRAFVLRASIRRMSRKDAFAAAGVKADVGEAWLADPEPRASGLTFAEEIEMARAIGALEHVEALARYAAQNPHSPKGLDIRTWLLERSHQDFIRKQAQAIVVGGEIFVRTPETTNPARLAADIEQIAKRLTFHLPALPAAEEIIDAVVREVEQEREEDEAEDG